MPSLCQSGWMEKSTPLHDAFLYERISRRVEVQENTSTLVMYTWPRRAVCGEPSGWPVPRKLSANGRTKKGSSSSLRRRPRDLLPKWHAAQTLAVSRVFESLMLVDCTLGSRWCYCRTVERWGGFEAACYYCNGLREEAMICEMMMLYMFVL